MRFARVALCLVFLLASITIGTGPVRASSCAFVLGFKTLHDFIPQTVGACLVDEHHNPVNGDGLQETGGPTGAGGLLVWRKADNWTAYTDGYHTWINGPNGLQERLNSGPFFPWEAQTAPSAPAKAAGAAFGDGTKAVGTDIAAGTYRMLTDGCYWARLSGFGGTTGDIIENGNTHGSAVVTISPSDKGFQSSGCGQWTPLAGAITPSQSAPFGDGVYVVGLDIAGGAWKSNGTGDCYWARLTGFGGGTGQMVSNDFTHGSAIVQIAPSDAGFEAAGCGTWTKIG